MAVIEKRPSQLSGLIKQINCPDLNWIKLTSRMSLRKSMNEFYLVNNAENLTIHPMQSLFFGICNIRNKIDF